MSSVTADPKPAAAPPAAVETEASEESAEETAAPPAAKEAAGESAEPAAEGTTEEGDPETTDKPLPGDSGKTTNPLNPAGDDLEKLIELRINEDLWKQVRGRLPCVDPTQKCIDELQTLAVSNAKALKAVDERVTQIEEKIAEATKNNKKSVKFAAFEPVLAEYLKYTPANSVTKTPATGGLITNILAAIANPTNAINQIFALAGGTVVKTALGGGNEAQTRAIAITDLTAKVTTLKQARIEAGDKLRERVSEELLAFDDARREFQASKEIAQREGLRSKILAVEYRLGKGETASYLAYQTTLDQKKIDTFRYWSRVRGRLQRLKLLALGTPDESE